MFSLPSPRSSHVFSQVPHANIPRSRFDRSHRGKTTLDAGGLVPIFLDEVLPGDTHSLQATLFARLATPIKPVMDNLFIETFWFFVPKRILWTNFEKFCGAQDNPGDSTSFTIPGISGSGSYSEMTLGDYLGLPINKNLGASVTNGNISALPFRAYNRIWDEWFRDENLQNRSARNTGDGPDAASDYAILLRGKRHDYFTSCLPWTQKATSVTIPLGTTAPVKRDSTVATPWKGYWAPGTTAAAAGDIKLSATSLLQDFGGTGITLDPQSGSLYADLSVATSATVNAWRQAIQLQVFYERDARGGTRFTEILLSHFGVVSPDFRLQRPEFLGSSSAPVNFTPVPQTQATGASGTTTAQGNLSAFATSVSQVPGFTKSFVEHGYVIGLVNIRANLTYQQGLNKLWSRSVRTDFYWPDFAHLGEQSVLNKEIYYNSDAADGDVFGYQERYAEYRYKESWCTGKMRSQATGTIDVWHLAQNFTSRPALNSTFIPDPTATTVDRVIQTPSEPQFILDCYFKLFSARPMPVYSVPGQISRF